MDEGTEPTHDEVVRGIHAMLRVAVLLLAALVVLGFLSLLELQKLTESLN